MKKLLALLGTIFIATSVFVPIYGYGVDIFGDEGIVDFFFTDGISLMKDGMVGFPYFILILSFISLALIVEGNYKILLFCIITDSIMYAVTFVGIIGLRKHWSGYVSFRWG